MKKKGKPASVPYYLPKFLHRGFFTYLFVLIRVHRQVAHVGSMMLGCSTFEAPGHLFDYLFYFSPILDYEF